MVFYKTRYIPLQLLTVHHKERALSLYIMTIGSASTKSIVYQKCGIFWVNELVYIGDKLENRSFGRLKDFKKHIMTQLEDINPNLGAITLLNVI